MSNMQPPPLYTIHRKENAIRVRGPLSEQDWEKIFDIMEGQSLTALHAAEIPAAAMQRLPRLHQLTTVSSGGIMDEGLLHLEKMPQLLHLDLGNWHSAITDKGLQVVRHLKNLRRFEMAWAQKITDAGIANLAGCHLLERVNLFGTNTGDGALKTMSGKQRLTHFSAGNRVTDAGLEHLQAFPVFKEWQGGAIEYDLMTWEPKPNCLMIGGTYTDNGLAKLDGLNGLFGLSLLGNRHQVTDKGIARLRTLQHLGFLSVDGDLCSDEWMAAIGRLPHLRMLLAQGAVAGATGWAALANSSTMEYIWGRECPHLDGKGFKALATMPALRGLAVSCKFVDDEALAGLPSFPSLKMLMPVDVTDDGFRHVGRCEQLEGLWCMYCRETTDRATGYIAGLKNLKKYYAGQTLITNRSLAILGGMDSLESLEFWNISGITQEGIASLARLPRLKELSFDSCINITQDSTRVFPASVRVSYSP